MPVQDLTAKVQERIELYQMSRERELIFEPEADRDAAALWRTIRAIDLETAPRWLGDQFTLAGLALGWLHYLRHRDAPDGQRVADLARALLCLEPLSGDFRALPLDLTRVIGRFTDSDAQAAMAASLLDASRDGDDQALLDACILLMTAAAAAPQTAAANRATRLSRLCLSHRRRYERDGDTDDLDRAVRAGERAVAITTELGLQEPGWCSDLAYAYWCRHRLHADPADLRRVIDLLQRALDLAGPSPMLLSELGKAYRHRYEHNAQTTDLEYAISFAEQALSQASHEDPADPSILANLGNCLLRRYERFGAKADLWQAADLAEQVVAATPAHDPQHVAHLAGAAEILLRRHERSQALTDVERAIDLYEQALAALPDSDTRRRDVFSGLSEALHQRYRNTGDGGDLNRAATLSNWALAATPRDHPDRPRATMSLAAILLTRYAYTGVLADITRSIESGEQVLAESTTVLPQWLSTLCDAYHTRFPVTGAVADLDRAIGLGERAVAATGEDEFALAGRSTRLAAAYRRRHGHTGSRTDLDRAIYLGERAVDRAPDDHAALPAWLSGLAATRLDRYHLDKSPSDLNAAITLGERALTSAPANHPSRSRLAAELCAAYAERVTDQGRAPEPEQLRILADGVANAREAAPVDRVSAHYAIGALAQAAGQQQLAVTMLDAATALLPSVAPRETGWADQQHRLGEHLDLVSAAVAAHCALGDPAGAVRSAELGRGILLASQASTRVDLVELAARDPALADRFRWTCERLNTADFPDSERKRWWADYDRLLTEIRALPGLSGFLAPPRMADLRPAAAGGCVVLLNVGRHRADALIVRAETDPVAIELRELNLAETQAKVAALLAAVDDGFSLAGALHRRRVIPEVLTWLWDTAIAPVADALRRDCVADGSGDGTAPSRVWWLPIGLLGLLPLHAAGRCGEPGALDAMLSSYIPSLRALRQARNRPAAKQRRHLTVAMHHTPGFAPLPAAASEILALDGQPLIDEHAIATAVLSALRDTTWAHFACHAVTDPASQADSGLRLHDRILRLPEIGGLRLVEAELAYLSACSTANHGVRYPDEILHLASAFQLAGFRHVVASLWPLDDDVADRAARAFYDRLPGTPDADAAAASLHEVTLRLRDEYPDRPDLWAPLIHSGP